MSEPTHTVVGKEHRRGKDGAPAEVFEPGDEITPTDAELETFPYRFAPIEEPEDEPETEDAEVSDEAEASDETEVEVTEIPDLDEANYDELRELAGDYEDIDGRAGEERLRAELKDKLGE